MHKSNQHRMSGGGGGGGGGGGWTMQSFDLKKAKTLLKTVCYKSLIYCSLSVCVCVCVCVCERERERERERG